MDDKIPLKDQQDFYDKWNRMHRSGDFTDIDYEIRLRAKKVLDILSKMKCENSAIIEVGCGTGWLAEKLCEFGRVVGVDLSPDAIEIARQRKCNANFIQADF